MPTNHTGYYAGYIFIHEPDISGNSTVHLYNSLGEEIYSKSFAGVKLWINARHFQPGNYTLIIANNSTEIKRQFVLA